MVVKSSPSTGVAAPRTTTTIQDRRLLSIDMGDPFLVAEISECRSDAIVAVAHLNMPTDIARDVPTGIAAVNWQDI